MIKKYKITNLFLILALATSCGIPYTTQPDLIKKVNPIISPIPQKIEVKTIKLLPFRKYIETKNGIKFFIDSSTQRILKIDKDGTTTVFAGGGTEKNISKGGKATDISFDALADIQFFSYDEANGDNKKGDNVLYVLDSGKNQVLRIDESGTITKVIGSGQKILDNKNTSENNASLNSPTSIALDKKGNVFIADSGNNQIKKVSNDIVLVLDLATQNKPTKRFFESPVLEVVAGTLNTTPNSQKAIDDKLSNPTALVIDNNGNIFISDTGNNQIKKIDTNGNISVVAGTTNTDTLPINTPVKSIDAKLSSPLGLTLDTSGNILFIDSGSNQLKKIDTNGILTNVLSLSQDTNKPVLISNPDGSVTSKKPDGSSITKKLDGTVINTRPDDSSVTTKPDGSVIARDANGSSATTKVDGTIFIQINRNVGDVTTKETDGSVTTKKLDGTIINTKVDGSATTKRLDGTIITAKPDSSSVTTKPDGTIITAKPDGSSITKRLDGTIITAKPDSSSVTTKPDGTIITTKPDGSSVTTKPDGTILLPNGVPFISDNNTPNNITSIDFSPSGQLIINNSIPDNTVFIPDNISTSNTSSTSSGGNTPSLVLVNIPINTITSVPVPISNANSSSSSSTSSSSGSSSSSSTSSTSTSSSSTSSTSSSSGSSSFTPPVTKNITVDIDIDVDIRTN